MDTTKLDDLLNQAETQESEQSQWIEDTNYITKNFYVDEHGVVDIKNKIIGDMSKHISVKGESYSQYIEFKMGRFFDGIDLTKMKLAIYFNIPNVGEDESSPINVYYNENEIKFGWVIPPEVAQVNLTIEFCIYARGKLSDGNDYVLKTKTAKYSIDDGLEIGNSIIKPTNNWYLNFVLEMDEKVTQATESADRAVQAASSVDGAVETVTTARDEVVQKASTVDTQHSEVESWHQESEQFRNEAEQFRNQAEAITGIGLAEEGKPGIVQPDGVTTKVDENGKLIVIGGGGGGGGGGTPGTTNYEDLDNKPKINGVELSGNKTLEELGFEGTTDYQALENKPSIAGVELSGDKSYDELGIASKEAVARNFETVNQNIQELDDYTQSLGEDIVSLDTELEQTNQQLQSTTDKVDDVQESIEAGFKKQATGEDISVNDSVDGKPIEFALYGKAKQNTTSGKNLLQYPYQETTHEEDGIVWTDNGDGTVKASGTATAFSELVLRGRTETVIPLILKAGTYILSGCPQGGSASTYRIHIGKTSASNTWELIGNDTGSGFTFTLDKDTQVGVSCAMAVGTTVNDVTFKPMVRLATITDDTWEPYTNGPSPNPSYPQEIETAGASGSIEVKSCGKNLLKIEGTIMGEEEWFITGDDGKLIRSYTSKELFERYTFASQNGHLNVTAHNSLNYLWLSRFIELKPNTDYFASNKTSKTFKIFGLDSKEVGASGVQIGGLGVFNSGSYKYYMIGFYGTGEWYPQIELGNTGTDFQPYKEAIATFQGEYAGIKVASGGNYTDENGQQWITDEIRKFADGSGEKVQRIFKGTVTSDNVVNAGVTGNGEFIQTAYDNALKNNSSINAISDKAIGISYDDRTKNINIARVYSQDGEIFFLMPANSNFFTDKESAKTWVADNNLNICYVLATPIITPLTKEEVAEIEKLQTYSSVTNISNDADCGMSVTYATLQEALMLQEAYNATKENAQEIVDIKKELSDTTFKVDTIIAKADLCIKETASGEEIHLVDSAEGKAVEYSLFGKTRQNTTSGKNLLENKATSKTINGVEFVVNEDKSITVNGEASETTYYVLNSDFIVQANTIMSGCPNGGSQQGYMLIATFEGYETKVELGNGRFIYDVDVKCQNFYIQIQKGVKVENITYYPMIRLASITDDTYEQFTNGASPNPQFPQPIEVSGESYNLMKYPYGETTHTDAGITWTDNGDGTVTANGTATDRSSFVLHYSGTGGLPLEKGDYILSGCPNGGSMTTYVILLNSVQNNAVKETLGREMGSGLAFTVDDTFSSIAMEMVIVSGTKAENLTFYPMIRKASVKNDRYMPFGVGSVEVKSEGKNLIPYPYNGFVHTDRGITWTDLGNGEIVANGTATADATFYFNQSHTFKAGSYIFSGCPSGGSKTTYIVQIANSDWTVNALDMGNGATVTLENDTQLKEFRIFIKAGATVNNLVFKPMLRLASETDNTYVPYREPMLSTIPTPNGLAGIKVSSGGNYTDQNGQQWICDEVVKFADGSGVLIQRVKKVIVTSKEVESAGVSTLGTGEYIVTTYKDCMNNNALSLAISNKANAVSYNNRAVNGSISRIYVQSGELFIAMPVNSGFFTNTDTAKEWVKNNEFECMYALAEPITTPLTAEQLAEIETFYPTTNISNDFDCGMSVKYVGEGIITTNTEIPIVAQDGELESGDNIVTLFGKIVKKLNSLASGNVQQQLTDIVARLDALERNQKTIIYSDTEPETVEENTIVMVYETEE